MLNKEEVKKMNDCQLAALEAAIEDQFTWYEADEPRAELIELLKEVNDVCLEHSVDSEYYYKHCYEEYMSHYNEFLKAIA